MQIPHHPLPSRSRFTLKFLYYSLPFTTIASSQYQYNHPYLYHLPHPPHGQHHPLSPSPPTKIKFSIITIASNTILIDT